MGLADLSATKESVLNRLFCSPNGESRLVHTRIKLMENGVNSAELQALLDYYEKEKGIGRDALNEAIKEALEAAAKKAHIYDFIKNTEKKRNKEMNYFIAKS